MMVTEEIFPLPFMNSVNKEAYSLTLKYKGVSEIVGTKNNRMIVVAHHLTGCSIETPNEDVDSTIPWCSSWMNLAIVCANIKFNPFGMADVLYKRGISLDVIKECFVFAGVDFDKWHKHKTGIAVVEPTWSAASKSWDTWGVSVPFDQVAKGDIVRLTRDGGGHVAFLDDEKKGLIRTQLLGGNQMDKVCSAKYLSNRIVTIRRTAFKVTSI